ncbi:hypothetical protein HMPREF0198_0064 [Cardiobacterium hominis ATCC 15826]|uniref:Uncharacterized protein n=1 Tax=Cardiobacterium hominis (strain ATCC 15826 / DSM 8339 / NCTC 10426 / 6573) TaxID=638300 RepID=C8N6D8_CARH6|nr:hypothetical protein HMPREF0198_0064 [Cardiobacterium hominis ATCC 15826]
MGSSKIQVYTKVFITNNYILKNIYTITIFMKHKPSVSKIITFTTLFPSSISRTENHIIFKS